MRKLGIILLCTVAAMAYGILHDQITARLCLEYFTVAHPPLFHTASPTRLAVYWGAAATAGIGLAFGAVLAAVSQSAGAPPVSPGQLFPRILRLLAAMGSSAFVAGCVGFYFSRRGVISIPASLAGAIPESHRDGFMAVWFAHMASYLVGFTGGTLLIARVWQARGRPLVLSLYPRDRWGVLRAVFLAMAVTLVVWRRFFALR